MRDLANRASSSRHLWAQTAASVFLICVTYDDWKELKCSLYLLNSFLPETFFYGVSGRRLFASTAAL